MKLHRFFTGTVHDKNGPLELSQKIWVHEPALLNQWSRVLRYNVGDQLVLFDGAGKDRLYEVHKIEQNSFGLELVTELEPVYPKREVYLFFSLLKKDKNEWVLQKCSELGVTHFVPIISDRTEKTGFDEARAVKIVTEAAEQCGRSDIPRIREPISIESTLKEFKDKITLFFAEQHEGNVDELNGIEPCGVFIGPEGGWTDAEKQLLGQSCIKLNIAQFTLRAETASVTASTILLQ